MVAGPLVSHILPGRDIIRELVARGHRVTYANDPAMAEVIAPTGAELLPYESGLPFVDNTWPEDPVAAASLFLDEAIRVLPVLRAAYERDPADLYLYDIAGYPGRVLAEAQGRPAVQLSPTFVAWKGMQEEIGAQFAQLPGYSAYKEKFASWLARCGATTTDVDAFSGLPRRALALISSAMQPYVNQVDTGAVTFVGPCLGDRTDQGSWSRPDGAEKVLLVSLGSAYTRQPEFYRQCLAAFGGLPGWHVVLQIGKYTDPAQLGPVPSNVEVRTWVPQLAILRQADAFVTHAGMGSCSEGLLTGVPMIAVPQGAEQFTNADRLVELGVARRIDTADATADALRTALTELTSDPEVARRSARLKAEALAEGGTSRAADLIEAMLPR
ncbi:macrolide family glycosyltransferase [Streptomyces sp. MST-110588]|uniref:macrolide family glycosyltransferase n=1 Tax=Streptomyces sp. MST-110588 TaxID=2833628 RepID=UPI001F5E2345|nr:macrolide family glycosyltransferase [Streptomyces sp. MST-110588]UNO43717.1 glycosyl transferase [Streptomyces sp. MST-110588]